MFKRGKNGGFHVCGPRSGGSLPSSRAFLSSNSLIFCSGSLRRGASSGAGAGAGAGADADAGAGTGVGAVDCLCQGWRVAGGEGGSLGLPASASIRA
jgi:hypothetical protein